MQQVVLDRERPQGSSEKALANFTQVEAAVATASTEMFASAVKAEAETALTQCRWGRGLRLRQEMQTPAAVAAEDWEIPAATPVPAAAASCA